MVNCKLYGLNLSVLASKMNRCHQVLVLLVGVDAHLEKFEGDLTGFDDVSVEVFEKVVEGILLVVVKLRHLFLADLKVFKNLSGKGEFILLKTDMDTVLFLGCHQ